MSLYTIDLPVETAAKAICGIVQNLPWLELDEARRNNLRQAARAAFESISFTDMADDLATHPGTPRLDGDEWEAIASAVVEHLTMTGLNAAPGLIHFDDDEDDDGNDEDTDDDRVRVTWKPDSNNEPVTGTFEVLIPAPAPFKPGSIGGAIKKALCENTPEEQPDDTEQLTTEQLDTKEDPGRDWRHAIYIIAATHDRPYLDVYQRAGDGIYRHLKTGEHADTLTEATPLWPGARVRLDENGQTL